MLETNIRIVAPGPAIYVWTRRAIVTGTHFTPDLLEKCCNKLRFSHGLAAVVHPTIDESLLVASREPIKDVHLEDEEWELEVTDSGDSPCKYTLNDPLGKEILPRLFERALLVTVKSKLNLWNFDSPRIWYKKNPIARANGFAAYERIEITGLYIKDVGIGIAVDIGTAFFTENDLEYYFNNSMSSSEQRRRREEFDRLRKRHGDHKGTLLYDHGDGHSKCYFVEANGETCATTGKIKIKGKATYNSLSEYYRNEKKSIRFLDDSPVVRVKFSEISLPQPVAANRLRLRVMNEVLPKRLRDIDKIEPQERRKKVLDFWKAIGAKPFGAIGIQMADELLWQPSESQQLQFAMPDLIFRNQKYLMSPQERSQKSYKSHFRQRMEYLDKFGCYFVPPFMNRKLYCAYPEGTNADINVFCDDLSKLIRKWTGYPVQVEAKSYNEIKSIVSELQHEEESGLVVFVLNEESNAYHEAAFLLSKWRIKRITQSALERHFDMLKEGAFDYHLQKKTLEQGRKKWDNFIRMSSLEVVQLLDTVPYRTVQTGIYDAQLIIDVSYDNTYFALSLLINRKLSQKPDFFLRTESYRKADHKHQAINPKILADEIVNFFVSFKEQFDEFELINSVLFVRDGQYYGATIDNEYHRETEGIYDAIQQLSTNKVFSNNCQVDLVNLHKDTLTGIRFWDLDSAKAAHNALEGQAIILDSKTIVVSMTGDGTLTNGTAQPFVIKADDELGTIREIGEAMFLSSQLNWSSPTVAQRLPVYVKRADELLLSRAAQEVRSPK